MQGLLLEILEYTALAIEMVAVVLVAFGAFEAFARSLGRLFSRAPAGCSAIAPTWDDIGKLAAIAVIRTFLNFFLERDIVELRRGEAVPRIRERAAGSNGESL